MSRRFQFSLKALLASAVVATIGLFVDGIQIAIALAIVSYGLFASLGRFFPKLPSSPLLWAFLAIAASWIGILALLVASEGY
jgi:hypothetical protein